MSGYCAQKALEEERRRQEEKRKEELRKKKKEEDGEEEEKETSEKRSADTRKEDAKDQSAKDVKEEVKEQSTEKPKEEVKDELWQQSIYVVFDFGLFSVWCIICCMWIIFCMMYYMLYVDYFLYALCAVCGLFSVSIMCSMCSPLPGHVVRVLDWRFETMKYVWMFPSHRMSDNESAFDGNFRPWSTFVHYSLLTDCVTMVLEYSLLTECMTMKMPLVEISDHRVHLYIILFSPTVCQWWVPMVEVWGSEVHLKYFLLTECMMMSAYGGELRSWGTFEIFLSGRWWSGGDLRSWRKAGWVSGCKEQTVYEIVYFTTVNCQLIMCGEKETEGETLKKKKN